MTARIIDGLALAKQIREEVAQRVTKLKQQGVVPGLAVILVGDNPASEVYVRNKVKSCAEVGIHSLLDKHPASLSEDALLARIHALNQDPSIHGILVQLPLPAHIDSKRVIEAINADKDVDGFDKENVGALMINDPLFRPCTPYGVMKMLAHEKIDLHGTEAVVVGASNIVGKPQAMMLLHAGATVTICNSKTRDLAAHTRRADVLVVAVGKAKMITADMIKPGAVIIDVGMNRDENGKLCGDVDFDSCRTVASAITPVPGGVGPMTIAMLLTNTIESAERLIPNQSLN